jgi:hypothetical protein
MKNLTMFGILVAILLSMTHSAATQSKAQSDQRAGNCSVNIAGNGNTASLACEGIDPTLAKQVREILIGTRRNESAVKDISEKLDQIINHINEEAIPPEVALRFVYPTSPALMIINQSDVLARDINYVVALWNVDSPDRTDALPIPSNTANWLKEHSEAGPEDLFHSPSVSPLLKPGNRLIGTASVNCATCARGRTYIVSIVWGEGGWVSEFESEKSGKLLTPSRYTKEGLSQYFASLEAAVPVERRIPIGDR